MFSISRTMMSLIDTPMAYRNMIDSDTMLLIHQGLLLAYKTRIPEKSSLFLSSLPSVLMHRYFLKSLKFCVYRSSTFYQYNLESFLTSHMDDRYNKELINSYNKEVNIHISHILLVGSIRKHMANFTKFGAGNVYEFDSVGIADIDAEFIRIPKYDCIEWYKRSVFSFLAKAVLREQTDQLYKIDFLSSGREFFVEVWPSEDIQHDYKNARCIYTLHTPVGNKQLKWINQDITKMKDMKKNTQECKEIVVKNLGIQPNYVKNGHLLNRELTNTLLNKNIVERSHQLSIRASGYINKFQEIQINKLESNLLLFNSMFKKSSRFLIDNLEKLITEKEPEEGLMKNIMVNITNFARIDKNEISTEILNSFVKKTDSKECKHIISSLNYFVESIEQHQHGMWVDSAKSALKLFKEIDYCLPIRFRLRILERAWYSLIA